MQIIFCTPGDIEIYRDTAETLAIPRRGEIVHLSLPSQPETIPLLRFRVEEVEWFFKGNKSYSFSKEGQILNRYLALSKNSPATTVVVLTVRSLAPATTAYIEQMAATAKKQDSASHQDIHPT